MTTEPAVADIEDLFRSPQYAQQPRLVHPTTTPVRPTRQSKRLAKQFQRNVPINKADEDVQRKELYHNFDAAADAHLLTEADAVREAARCLKCADAPCQKACPTAVDVKAFLTSLQNRNIYGAAQMILSANPCGYTTGTLCMTSELCASACNLSHTAAGPIPISKLQQFVLHYYAQMQVSPRVVPHVRAGHYYPTPPKRIALIGAGPASLACATFLARLGGTDTSYVCDVYEQRATVGGLGQWEIPQFRLAQAAVQWEWQQVQQLPGVTVHTHQGLGKDFTVTSLLSQQNYNAVFLGIGKPQPQRLRDVFHEMGPAQGYYDSHQFLEAASRQSKGMPPSNGANAADLESKQEEDPEELILHGRVLVLGGGDVAIDCARTAYRLGASRVTLCLRRNTTHFRATEEQVTAAMSEQVDVLPYALPKQVLFSESNPGKIRALELYKTEQDEHGKYAIDDDQFVRVKCDYVVSAFGSQADPALAQALQPVAYNKWNEISVNDATGQTVDDPRVFAGGDCVGSDTQVAATNDGKVAAWGIHCFLQNMSPENTEIPAALPSYTTEIDNVDISVTICGVKFPNPFGLASAPPTTSCEMIARAFAQGWGFAVTKTFTNDASQITNVSPRIFSPLQGAAKDRHYQEGFINIELISEKTAEYWCNGIRELKRRFPDRVVVASIMSSFEKDSWQEITRMACEAGSDMIEMNLSCPHGMHEKGMGLALGVYPDKVRSACSWVVEASTIPVFAKLTPNVTDITVIAQAAREGGVDGVTAINTVSGLTGFHTDASPGRWGVGHDAANKGMTYGGLCGNTVRPLAFRAISAIAKKIPGIPLMATGGIDSADVAVQMMYAGAPLMQICSAVMNQDYTIIHDLVSGLKSTLYMRGRKHLQEWMHGMPPIHEQDLEVRPKFGPLEMERRQLASESRQVKIIVKPLDTFGECKEEYGQMFNGKPLMVEDLVGKGLEHIKTFTELNNREQVVAYVDPDLCLNCGKCYSTCNDNGYQAITFDPDTHVPVVDNDKCTGCGMCESICPALPAITLQNRVGYKEPTRNKKDL
uniref:dihydropyrimidine dehydrogenase (NADP(+)) n=1 Tax=Amphora coffeiformis TaxID=265554 RepID=A0A7S3L168_9STRA|mmetsp:Transcript_6794/g.13459  ORF Transcript_6794/g.13459 Transcript_6794/m.13459 type:complete len:1047 (-) Transcript_6794:39-3179(-)